MDKKQAATWIERITSRKSAFEKGWWAEAEKATKLYDCPEKESQPTPFNILYANTEILLPSLYSSTPRPEVGTRPAGRQEVSEAVSRLLVHLLDDNVPSGAESFDDALEGATLSGLVPGAGGVRLRYYPDSPQPLRWEEFKYNQLVWGWARKWSRVPWLAFIHPMTKGEIAADFGVGEERLRQLSDDYEEGTKKPPTYCVFELWDKAKREVAFLCEEVEGHVLREVPDSPELQLAGFFPTPGLLTLVRKPNDVEPTPLYSYYQRQAEELNRITVRLEKVVAAIRVRGVYNGAIGPDLASLLGPAGTENALIPSTNPVDLSQGGFEKHIWMLPIEKLVQVAQQLYQARQSVLQVIYQLTGLADIVRGSTAASESATAQSIKDKWGGLRLKRMQRTVGLYVRQLLRIAAELAAKTLPPDQWAQMTGLNLPTAEQKQQMVLQYQQAAAVAQMQGQQPPPPPQLMPSWEEVLGAISSGSVGLLVDIETNSTLDPDSQADQKEVGEFLGPFSQLVGALAPIAQMGPAGLDAAKALLVALLKRYKLGREVERAFSAIKPPPPAGEQGPDPKLEAEKAKAAAEMQALQAKAALDQEKMALERRKLQLEAEKMERQAQLDAAKFQQQMVAAMMPPAPRVAPVGGRRPA